MNIRKFICKIMSMSILFCSGSVISAMQRVSHLPTQIPQVYKKRPTIKITGLEGKDKKIVVPVNIAEKSVVVALMIADLKELHASIKDITVSLEARIKVIEDSFDALKFPGSLQEKLKTYSLSELIERSEFLHKYDFSQNIVDLFTIRIEEKQRENIPSIASRIQKEPWRLKKAKESHEAILKRQKPIIKFHGLKDKNDEITVPLNLIQNKSVIIKSMIADLAGPEGVMPENVSIPLDASPEIIRDIFHTLIFPDSVEEKLKNYSLRELIERDNFLVQYNFVGSVADSATEKIKTYSITNMQDDQIIEQLNRDEKKILFTDPAIAVLENIIIANHINDKDRRTILHSYDPDGLIKFAYPASDGDGVVLSSDPLTSIYSLAFSPDGKKMVSGGSPGHGLLAKESHFKLANLLLWMIDKDGNINPLPQAFSTNLELPSIASIAFSHDGKQLVAGGYNEDKNSNSYNLMMWTFKDDGSIDPVPQFLDGHARGVNAVAFHPKREIMVSGGEEHHLLLWSFQNDGTVNMAPQKLLGHAHGIKQIIFSSNGRRMVSISGGKDPKNNLLLWIFNNDGSINTTPKVIMSEPYELDAIALSSDGKKLVSSSGKYVHLWDLSDLNNIVSKQIAYSSRWSHCSSVAFSHNDKKIIMLGGGGHRDQMFLFGGANFEHYCKINSSDHGCSAIFSPDDKKIVAGFNSCLLVAWNLFKPEEKKMLRDLSHNLTVAQGQLIIRLSKLLREKKKESLSSFYEQVYYSLPFVVQKLFKDAVSNQSIVLRFKKSEAVKTKLHEYFNKPQYQDKQKMKEEIDKLKRIYRTAPQEISQLCCQALNEFAQERGF